MEDIMFTPKGVEKLLLGLKIHKAAGPDGITPRVLKQLAKTLAPILCHIFRLSYETGEIPEDWREANVVPIYKKGNRSTLHERSSFYPYRLPWSLYCQNQKYFLTKETCINERKLISI